jgi:2-aminomuconate deaminase
MNWPVMALQKCKNFLAFPHFSGYFNENQLIDRLVTATKTAQNQYLYGEYSLMSDPIISPNAPQPVGLYPHARRAGNLLFLSGIGPRNPADNSIPGQQTDAKGNFTEFDFEAQVHSVFRNVKTVLEASGAQWNQLVDVTVFLVNMRRDFNTFNRLYAEYFKENQPCRTTVEVNCLPVPIAIELKCVAYLP